MIDFANPTLQFYICLIQKYGVERNCPRTCRKAGGWKRRISFADGFVALRERAYRTTWQISSKNPTGKTKGIRARFTEQRVGLFSRVTYGALSGLSGPGWWLSVVSPQNQSFYTAYPELWGPAAGIRNCTLGIQEFESRQIKPLGSGSLPGRS